MTITATDSDGLAASTTFALVVDNVATTVGLISATLDPVEVNTTVNASAEFTDPGTGDTHSGEWDWGDNTTSSATIVEVNGSGTAGGSHSYTAAGVYTVSLTVTDDDGDSGESIFQFIVVYHPDGGFVTGGGWIDSPLGAYAADQSIAGKARFGFVSKYQNGSTTPTGKTQFQFRVADLNFNSTLYDWLVVAGPRAQFKGSGTINGQGNFGFMIVGIDGDVPGGGESDKFRIKIWDTDANDLVVYDNQPDEADDSSAATILGGGSVVIRR